MLDLIRKKQQSVLVKFVFWGIIATFVGTIFLVWGRGSDRASDGSSVAITVNGTDIGVQEYQNAHRNLYQFYQNLYGDRFNAEMEKQLNLGKAAINQLIRQVLLEQEGKRLGIEVSEQEMVDSISKIPQFQKDGVFDRATYLQVLNYQRISPEDFETSQERTLFVDKVEEKIMDAVTVEESDVEAEFRKQNDKVNLSFVRLAPASFESKVKVQDGDLEEYFNQNREQFQIPTRIALRYLLFEPGRYVDEVPVDEAAINKFYERNLDKYEIEEQVDAAHILIKVEKDAEEDVRAEKRKLAEKVLEQAKAGEDFAKLARQYSDDTGSAAKGGDLGYFSRGTMVPAFEQAAFALKPGKISDIVESPFGFHIIKMNGYIEPGVKPLAEVLDDVKAGLKKDGAVRVAFEKAMDAYNINRKTGDLEKAAAENDLGVKETGLFDRQKPGDGIEQNPALLTAAFALEKGELARPVRTGSGIYLISLKEREESHIPEFSAVKKKVEEAYRKSESIGLAKKAAEKILAGLQAGKKFSSLAKEADVKFEETGLFAQSYGAFVPRIGNAEKLAEKAFELSEENRIAPDVYELGDRFVVAQLKEKQPADMSELTAEKREQLRETVSNTMRREVLDARVAELKEEAEITAAPFINQLLEEG
ncbi:MAG: hypothetical protein C0623_05340 [Desulfuromonas sp.]|nr:MAG: hypothetical protein C0623_05340 [Desulfuromonas sp.]